MGILHVYSESMNEPMKYRRIFLKYYALQTKWTNVLDWRFICHHHKIITFIQICKDRSVSIVLISSTMHSSVFVYWSNYTPCFYRNLYSVCFIVECTCNEPCNYNESCNMSGRFLTNVRFKYTWRPNKRSYTPLKSIRLHRIRAVILR